MLSDICYFIGIFFNRFSTVFFFIHSIVYCIKVLCNKPLLGMVMMRYKEMKQQIFLI